MMTYIGVKLLYAYNHPTDYLANWQKNLFGILPASVDTGVIQLTKDKVGPFKKK